MIFREFNHRLSKLTLRNEIYCSKFSANATFLFLMTDFYKKVIKAFGESSNFFILIIHTLKLFPILLLIIISVFKYETGLYKFFCGSMLE